MVFGVQVRIEEREGKAIIRLMGRIDASSTPVLENKLRPLLEKSDRVALDFAKVDYLSSAGLRLLLAATKKLKARKGKLVCFSLSDDVLEIIKMAGFEKIISLFSHEQDALAALD